MKHIFTFDGSFTWATCAFDCWKTARIALRTDSFALQESEIHRTNNTHTHQYSDRHRFTTTHHLHAPLPHLLAKCSASLVKTVARKSGHVKDSIVSRRV